MERSAAYTHFTASSNALRVAMAHMVGEMENAFFGFDAWNGELLVIILTQQEREITHDMPLQPHHTAENTI